MHVDPGLIGRVDLDEVDAVQCRVRGDLPAPAGRGLLDSVIPAVSPLDLGPCQFFHIDAPFVVPFMEICL